MTDWEAEREDEGPPPWLGWIILILAIGVAILTAKVMLIVRHLPQ